MEVAGARGTGARGHGFPNRGHQEVARVHATSAMPRRRLEERSEAAVAISSEQELPGRTRNKVKGRGERGEQGDSYHGENKVGDGSGTAARARWIPAFFGGCGFRGVSESEKWSGEQERDARGLGFA